MPYVELHLHLLPAIDDGPESIGIVMAHPERAAQLPASRGVLEHELAAGSVLQLTAWSFVGLFGDQARSLGMWLLETAPRTVIASDAHGRIRMPALRLAFDALRAAGERDPGQFMERGPLALLERGLANRPAALVA